MKVTDVGTDTLDREKRRGAKGPPRGNEPGGVQGTPPWSARSGAGRRGRREGTSLAGCRGPRLGARGAERGEGAPRANEPGGVQGTPPLNNGHQASNGR